MHQFLQLCLVPQQSQKQHHSVLLMYGMCHCFPMSWGKMQFCTHNRHCQQIFCVCATRSTRVQHAFYNHPHTHVSKHLCIGVFLGNMSGEVVFAIELEMAHPALMFKGGIVPVFPLVSYPSPNVCKPLTTNWTNLTPRQVTATEVMIHVLVHRNIHLIHTTEISVLWELASVSHSEGRETVCTIHIGMQIRQSSTCPTEQKHDSFWH